MDVPGGLEYVPAGPVVRTVVPAQALAAGNEALRILGGRFKGGARVKIGALNPVGSAICERLGARRKTPRHAAGIVDVTVLQDSESAAFPGGLQFVNTRTAPSVAPPSAALRSAPSSRRARKSAVERKSPLPAPGSRTTRRYRFGGAPARSVKVDGSRVITAVTPMHAPGPVSVLVANDGALSSLEGKFSFACPAAPDKTMVLMVLLAGALGGLVHALRSLFWYAGEQKLLVNWVPMYVLLPFWSSALGFVFYLVIRAGLYQPTAGTSYLLVGLAALVGLFSAQATEKLKAIAEGVSVKPRKAQTRHRRRTRPPMFAPTISGIKPSFGPLPAEPS